MNNSVNADMREFWNGEGGKKWLRFENGTKDSLMPFGRLAMEKASISVGERVVDVGCGCGDTTIEIAGRVGSSGYARGIDISEPIIAHAKRQAAFAANANVEFERGDAQTHQFEPAAFDVVFSRFGAMFFDDSVAAFKNLRSALKPGGRLAFITWQSAKKNEWVNLSLGVVAKHVTLPAPRSPEDPGPFSFGDPARIYHILDRAGFSGIGAEGVESPFIVGENLGFATEFLTQMGPPGAAIAKSGANEETKTLIASDMRDAIRGYETAGGVAIGASTWIVTAQNA